MNQANDTEVQRRGAFKRWTRLYLQRRYTLLFYTLLFTLVANPIIAMFGGSGILIDSLLAANLLVAVMPFEAKRPRKYVLEAMVLLWVAYPISSWLGHPTVSAIILTTWTLIGLSAAAVALRFAMRSPRVDAEHLFAALSAYLLAGIYFGLLYFALEQLKPGTFVAASAFSKTGAIYFSFVTLATLGYGDIVPRTDVARGIAILEAVGGQLFLAVLVARLLSLHSKSTEE
ncbi:MAG TPA: potassium channel family protein [Terriglobales bacterium]